ncbi:MAG TPA: methyltransferase domain-containing protein [Ktedonobacteraceae bacterium]|nr:methyltransferase domain-containing protein [Ktedonobacteraceae bacterium]
MSVSNNASGDENTYFIDAENAAEMARLTVQDRLTTKAMGGLLPEQADVSGIYDILDIACGPGAWVLDMAQTYPEKRVTGIDISRLMIAYAQAQAREKDLNNASFQVMDALKPLEFADHSFDLVNARFIFSFMPATAWPKLLQECLRILQPGGIIRLTESEWYFTNSAAYERLHGMVTQAMHLAGLSFSPDGRMVGITPMLARLLRDAGFAGIAEQAHMINLSAGTEAHQGLYQNLLAFLKLIQPFLIKTGVTTQAEVDSLYYQAMGELMSDEFCAVSFLLTAWGTKPG